MSEVLDTKSYNMVQARQDLVALYQGIIHQTAGGTGSIKTSSGMKSIVGFFIVLLLPMLVILLLYLGNQVISTEDSSQTLVETIPQVETTKKVSTKTNRERIESKKQTSTEKTKKTVATKSVKKTTTQTVVPRTNVGTKTKTVTKPEAVVKPAEVDSTITYGLLTVSADNSAQVYVDGKKIRGVPLVDYKVAEGKHTIIVAQNLTERQRLEVTIEKGYSYIYVWSFFNNRWTRKEKSIISK